MEQTNQIQKNETLSYDVLESLIINGDLSKLNQQQKVEYYQKYCATLGLNPVTQPFSILKLNGKEKLYCGREGTAQLSKVHGVSHEIISTETLSGVFVVKAKAKAGNRYTTSTGVVTIDGLKGDALCNAFMKAETKAKRRATLDLLGLGMLDETEVETIKGVQVEEINHVEMKNEVPEFKSTTHDKPFLNQYEFNSPGVLTKDWENVSASVAEHKCTIEYVESKFKLSKETKELLIEIQKTGK